LYAIKLVLASPSIAMSSKTSAAWFQLISLVFRLKVLVQDLNRSGQAESGFCMESQPMQ
jgi:hypothetical protein